MSTLFLRTLRDDPADAEVASHRLLVRAGYIRRVAPGGFSWLPLGWIVYRNVERIVREEMDAAGFQEVHFPALLPREPYEISNRWEEYGPNLFRLQDRRGADMLLAPTHEEMFTLMVKDLYGSYRDLPLVIYQIQTKYRDEARPRAGLLRGREFVMKDSYSFDLTDEGLAESYQRHRDAYIKLFERLGLPVRHRVGDVGGDGRFGIRGVPRPARDRRGQLRAVRIVRLCRQRRSGRHACAAGDSVRRAAGRDRARHAEHADDRHARRLCEWRHGDATRRAPDRPVDRGRHAEERDRHVASPRRLHVTAGDRRARRPRRRHEAPGGCGRSRCRRGVHRGRLRQVPDAGQGIHRARCARRGERVWHSVPGRPPRRRRHGLDHRRRSDRHTT